MTRFRTTTVSTTAAIGHRLAAAAAAVLLSASAPAWGADEGLAALRAEADWQYETQHFAAALSAYERLAMQGDTDAAQRAGEMLLFANVLFGKSVPHDPARARVWLKQAAAAGSTSAQRLVDRLDAPRGSAPRPGDAPNA